MLSFILLLYSFIYVNYSIIKKQLKTCTFLYLKCIYNIAYSKSNVFN